MDPSHKIDQSQMPSGSQHPQISFLYQNNRKTLIPLYQTLVRSILDYGSPIYGLVTPSQLRLLDTIQNSAIRFATGAFRTSSALSLCAETGIPPLDFRRLTLTAKLLTAIIRTPIFHSMMPSSIPYQQIKNITYAITSKILSTVHLNSTASLLSYPPLPLGCLHPSTSYSHSLSFLKIQILLQFTALTSTKSSVPSLVTRTARKVTTESALHFPSAIIP